MSAQTILAASVSEAPARYSEAVSVQRERAETEAVEAREMVSIIDSFKIGDAKAYEECGEIVKEVKGKIKFLDQERKVTVTPLNDEVSRINAWYKPALTALEKVASKGLQLMSDYVLQQRKEEARLLQEAQEAAQKVLEKSSNPTGLQLALTGALVQAAADSAPPKVQGISAPKSKYTFKVTDAAKLIRNHPQFAMPDMKAIGEWVSTHGLKDVPAGVEVEEHVGFTVRS